MSLSERLSKWLGLVIRNEWVFLFLMGAIMAGLSFIIDVSIEILQERHYIFYMRDDLGKFWPYLPSNNFSF